MRHLAIAASLTVLWAAAPALAQEDEGLSGGPQLLTPSDRRDLEQSEGLVDDRLARIRQGLASISRFDRAQSASALEQLVVELYGQAERLQTVSVELIDTLALGLAHDDASVLGPAKRSVQLLLANCQAETGKSAALCAAELGVAGAMHSLARVDALQSALELLPVNRGPGLDKHMATAIGINWERMGQYADLSAATATGRWDTLLARKDSYLVSLYMLSSEQSTRGLLLWLDWQASDLNAEGIPILAEDVIPLRPRDVRTPPTYRGQASDAAVAEVEARLTTFRTAAKAALESHDFATVSTEARDTLRDLIALEERESCHFAMTRHMVASVGYGALRVGEHVAAAPADQRQEVRDLAASYLGGNLMGMVHGFAVRLDRWAQDVHARGVGIVVNEFPGGHFLRAVGE